MTSYNCDSAGHAAKIGDRKRAKSSSVRVWPSCRITLPVATLNLAITWQSPGNQGMRAVALILELTALDPFQGHWLRRRYTLKCLYCFNFFNRGRLDSCCRPLRGQTVRLADVVEFLRELGDLVWRSASRDCDAV